jgi:hypothetical protein
MGPYLSADGSLSERYSNHGQETVSLVEAFAHQIAVVGVMKVAPSRVFSRVGDTYLERVIVDHAERSKYAFPTVETRTTGWSDL